MIDTDNTEKVKWWSQAERRALQRIPDSISHGSSGKDIGGSNESGLGF